MATIYKAPDGLEAPELDFKDVQKYKEEIKTNEEKLKQWCVDRCVRGGKDTKNVGEVIRFPVADGYAEYMVASMTPLQLIHLEYYDAYSFEYAHRLTKKDVEEKIQGNRVWEKLQALKKK